MIETNGFDREPFGKAAGAVCGSVLSDGREQALGRADEDRLLGAV
jgi:hypothetical protein